jgi:hypothetical protein
LSDDLDTQGFTDKKRENLFTAIYIGAVLILVAIVYFMNLNLWNQIIDFFSVLTLSQVPGIGIPLPAPTYPSGHVPLYNSAFQFSLGIGIIELFVLSLRVSWHSPVARKAETIENIVFWLGASYLIGAYLVNMTIAAEWFVFWAAIILIFGLALLTRAFVIMAKR